MEQALKAIVGGFSYIVYYRAVLARALLFPFGVICVLYAVGAALQPQGIGAWLFSALYWALFAFVAVTVHRVVILGENAIPKWGVREMRSLVWIFVGYELILFGGFYLFLSATLYLVAKIISPEIMLAAWLIFAFIAVPYCGLIIALMRLSLVFPGTAVNEDPGLKESWRLTSHRKWFMFLVVVLYPAVLMLMEALLYLIPGVGYLSPIIDLLLSLFIIAALSVAYTMIRNDSGDMPG